MPSGENLKQKREKQFSGIDAMLKKLNFALSKLGHFQSWKRVLRKVMVCYVAPERPRRFPVTIQIEATSRCNLRCPSCSHSREQEGGRHLTEEDFRRILDRLPWSPPRVILSGVGEPLANPRFFSLVDILAERKIKCEFYTNGTLLNERTRQAILSRNNIESISISCDGAQKETFECLRVGADFDRWRQSVHEFLTEAKQQRGQTLNVGMNIVVSNRNLHEIVDLIRLAAAMGFGGVSIMDPIPVDEIAAALCPSPGELSTVRQEELFALARSLGLKILCFYRRGTSMSRVLIRCLQPWEYMFIRANGDIEPCCALFASDKKAMMGNILKQDFEEIWRGRRYREYRKGSVSGTNETCRICPYH